MNLEYIFTLCKVRTRLDPMKGGVTICGRAPEAWLNCLIMHGRTSAR